MYQAICLSITLIFMQELCEILYTNKKFAQDLFLLSATKEKDR